MNAYRLFANSLFNLFSKLMLCFLVLIFALPTLAEDSDDPASRVARISYVQGSVSIQIANSDDWVEARINRPLTDKDQIWTDRGSRTELQVGMASMQLDQNTQLGILELSDNVLQLQLTQGVINVNVRGMDNDDTIEIDTPNASITIPEPGNYRIEVGDHDDLTIVQVRNGSADVAGERQHYSVRENEQLRLRGSDRLNAQFDDLNDPDDFDRWVASRNNRARNATAARYVDENVIGYEDLDDYGYWRWETGYGNVWYPSQVTHDWSPYRFGHWDWVAPWGWTWIDDAAWGFTPSHYGRWAEVHHRWCWVPGQREVRAVYAPALVAWVGSPGASVSINASGGSVGWIPLAPREIYRPYYKASNAYLARVNISNSLLKREEFDREYKHSNEGMFVNRGGASVVAAVTFTSAGNIHRNLLPIDAKRLSPFETINRFRPDRPALLGNTHVISRPAQVMEREVVVQRRPTPFIPHPELPTPHNIAVGGSLRMIEPTSPHHSMNEHRDEVRHENNSPENNNGNEHRTDRWGRGHDHLEDRSQHNDNDVNENQRREWRDNPSRDRHETLQPNTTQQRFAPPQQNNQQSPQPEHHRIGSWVHDEQQLRPPVQSRPSQAPIETPPASRADQNPAPSRPAPSPPAKTPPRNDQDIDQPNRSLNRREIR